MNNTLTKINIYGAGDHGKVVMDIIKSLGMSVGRFYDDSPHANTLCGCEIQQSSHSSEIEGPIVISIGNNSVRKRIAEKLSSSGINFPIIIHPSAVISNTVKIGEGTVISQRAVVQVDSIIGRYCIINTGAIVDHDCIVGDFVHIAPGSVLCGKIEIGEGTWIGTGTVIIPGVKIGKNCMIGAGSLVLKDVPDNCTAYGHPAKVVK